MYTLLRTSIMELVGKKLSELRKARGLTQAELARQLEISQRMVTYYENDAKKLPAHLLPKLAKSLGIDLETLAKGSIVEIKTKPKVNNRLIKRIDKFEQLPANDQRMILRMIDTLAQEAKAS